MCFLFVEEASEMLRKWKFGSSITITANSSEVMLTLRETAIEPEKMKINLIIVLGSFSERQRKKKKILFSLVYETIFLCFRTVFIFVSVSWNFMCLDKLYNHRIRSIHIGTEMVKFASKP